MKDWCIAEEAKRAKQFKSMKFQIYQLQANLNVDDGGSKRTKYNINNSDLQGIKRTVRMEDKDEE